MNQSATPVNLETTVTQSPNLVTSTIGEEVVMMFLEKSAYYSLDDIGSYIWQSIQTPMQVSQLCQQLAERFEVTSDRCQTDVLQFLNQIYEQGIIEVVSK
jgi:hypothetical protein